MARGFNKVPKIKAPSQVMPQDAPQARAVGGDAMSPGPLAPQPTSAVDSRLKRSTDDPRLVASEDRTVVESRDQIDDSRFDEVDDDWSFDKMPALPQIPGYRTIWLSTTHKQDTVPRRIRLGYELLHVNECPDLRHLSSKYGDYGDVIMCEEMLAAKIDEQRYQKYMTHFHHKKPLEDEGGIKEEIERVQARALSVRGRVDLEGGMQELGKARKPKFV